jgi:hypothetical protein
VNRSERLENIVSTADIVCGFWNIVAQKSWTYAIPIAILRQIFTSNANALPMIVFWVESCILGELMKLVFGTALPEWVKKRWCPEAKLTPRISGRIMSMDGQKTSDFKWATRVFEYPLI